MPEREIRRPLGTSADPSNLLLAAGRVNAGREARLEPRHDPPHQTEPIERPEAPAGGARFVTLGLLFYGGLAIAAVVWRLGLYGEPIWLAPDPGSSGPSLARDTAIGAAAGLALVGLSSWMTNRTSWGEALARALAAAIGRLSVPDALLLALASGLAEEMFFRGALQPRVGWLVASLLFGCVHFVPRRELLPWTAFAVAAGLLFGALFSLTGSLTAPVVAHVVVNGVNLPLLARRYGPGPEGGDRADPDTDRPAD